MSNNEHVIKEIQKIRETIKKKFRAHTFGELETKEIIEKLTEPITKPLKAVGEPLKQVASSVKGLDDRTAKWQQYLDKGNARLPGKIAMKYMWMATRDTKGQMDKSFGVRNVGGQWMIGQTPVNFEGPSILVEGKRYEATKGLCELLFLKKPLDYTSRDLLKYRDILVSSEAHLNKSGRLRSSGSYKYTRIISKLFDNKRPYPRQSRTRQTVTPVDDIDDSTLNADDSIQRDYDDSYSFSGTGLSMQASTSYRPDYIYWDDPNELCERLRLLVSSAQAGHTGHNNEIIALIEELKEAGTIKGSGNSNFLSLLK